MSFREVVKIFGFVLFINYAVNITTGLVVTLVFPEEEQITEVYISY